jgi:hypothetical protein
MMEIAGVFSFIDTRVDEVRRVLQQRTKEYRYDG